MSFQKEWKSLCRLIAWILLAMAITSFAQTIQGTDRNPHRDPDPRNSAAYRNGALAGGLTVSVLLLVGAFQFGRWSWNRPEKSA